MNSAPAPAAALQIRPAVPADLTAVQAIYAHHVLHGTASFEIEPPEIAEMQQRHAKLVGAGLPFLVAEIAGAVVGYGYAGTYRPRPAYLYTVEDSIYVHPAWCGRGLGRQLLARVIGNCEAAGRRQMIAVIGDSANVASVRLHVAAGFREVGVLRSVGRKFGRWLDTVLMQRSLGSGADVLPAEKDSSILP
jgi:phosphinothricin acetyltransferase